MDITVRTMFIQTETTPNEASLKFIPGVPVLPNGGGHEFLDLRSALPSPLATRLLTIEGVTSVFFGPDFVTCSKDDSITWALLKPEVFATLMEHFSSGAPIFKEGQESDGAEDTRILDTDSEVVGMIKELLETRVRPAIQEDGGDIEYKGFEETAGIVKLKLKGSCRGCSSSSVTLKNGIERMLMHYVPEVKLVEQVSRAWRSVSCLYPWYVAALTLRRCWMRKSSSHSRNSQSSRLGWKRRRMGKKAGRRRRQSE
jgi:Fe-S cluster biogenesis protein NfuA